MTGKGKRLLDRLEAQEGPIAGPLPHPATDDWQDVLTWVARRSGVPLDLQSPRRPTAGDQLLVARLARGLTQDAVAQKAGVRRATVADIEAERSDGRNPRLVTLADLARVLEIDLVVFGGER